MIPLKYNTAGQEIPLGYFLDSTDGDTEETGLTIANTDIKIWKNGATTLVNKNSGGATHISNGLYYTTLDATDTNTYGPMTIFVHVSGALSVKVECIVMNALVWDALYGTDKLEVDTVQLAGTTQDATDLADFASAGYDPATNKVQGVVLVDTCTTNTDMVSEPPTAIENRQEMDSNSTELAKIGTIPAIDGAPQTIGGALGKIVDDSGGAGYDATTDSLEAIRNQGDSAWVTGAGGSDRLLMVDTTIATLASQTSFTLTSGSPDDDAYNNCTIVIENSTTSTQKAVGLISDYVGATKTVTLKYDPAIFTIATGDKVYILAENSLKTTLANRQLDVTATGAAGIDWGNIENKDTVNDLSATDIRLVDTCTTNTDMVGTDNAALASVCTEARLSKLTNLPEGIQKNVALTNFEFFMADSSDNITGKTGLTITAQRSIDGGAFTAMTNSATEIGNGLYKIDLSQSDTNGTIITYRFSASGAVDTIITFKTSV